MTKDAPEGSNPASADFLERTLWEVLQTCSRSCHLRQRSRNFVPNVAADGLSRHRAGCSSARRALRSAHPRARWKRSTRAGWRCSPTTRAPTSAVSSTVKRPSGFARAARGPCRDHGRRDSQRPRPAAAAFRQRSPTSNGRRCPTAMGLKVQLISRQRNAIDRSSLQDSAWQPTERECRERRRACTRTRTRTDHGEKSNSLDSDCYVDAPRDCYSACASTASISISKPGRFDWIVVRAG